jgi:hypothetical protein
VSSGGAARVLRGGANKEARMEAFIRSEWKVLGLCTVAVCLGALAFIPGTAFGEDQDSVKLTFAPPAGTALQYETKWTEEFYVSGMDIVQNQSYDVAVTLDSLMEGGTCRLSLTFTNASSSMVIGDNIQTWSPPIRLGGKTVIVDVGSNGEIRDISWQERVPGVRRPEELKDILAIWFMELPDTVKQVGERWRKEIEEGELYAVEGEDEGRPEVRGWADITFKKAQEKLGIPVALLEVKSEAEIYKPVDNGMLAGKGEGKAEYNIAIDGGYIVEMKQEFEMKGKITNAEGEENETAIVQSYEMKLKK